MKNHQSVRRCKIYTRSALPKKRIMVKVLQNVKKEYKC
jgi:hypothetical protein